MTASVTLTIHKPHDVVVRLRVVAVSDGAVQSEQMFGIGSCEAMSEPVTLHAGVLVMVDELQPDEHPTKRKGKGK